jgi:cytochrome bd-type quinol oxidase subunit 1/mono/diheme cytochrome c family protein
MHYPWWYVQDLTAPMLIAVISVVHVLVSHYAVGGGLFLAVEVGHAYRTKDKDYLAYLKRHAAFFVLLTVVFGAITGVAIWWTIGLASPLATEWLIRIFVFGWATEWVFFVVELAAAFLFFYYWGRLSEKTHVTIGWIYALSAWISLVLITGITAFMLNPGGWLEHKNFWVAIFNPEFLPQTVARTGGALLLSSLYVYLHASLTIKDAKMRDMIGARSARPALLGAVLITVGGLGWYYFLPESAKAALTSAAVLNVLMFIIFALTIVVFFLLYLGPYKNPGWLSPGFAIALFLFGLAAFSTGEFIREAVRKPYVVYNVVLGNQILPSEVAEMRDAGYLESGIWTKAYVKQHFPGVMQDGVIQQSKLKTLPPLDRVQLGEVLFQYHCNDCHAVERGYSAVGPLLRGKSRDTVASMVKNLHETQFFMPPWSGTSEEAEIVTDYLMTISPQQPQGMRLGTEPTEVK